MKLRSPANKSTSLLQIQGIHEILFQMHKLVIHDPRITTRPKMFPNVILPYKINLVYDDITGL